MTHHEEHVLVPQYYRNEAERSRCPRTVAQKNGTIIPSADLDLFPDYGKGRTLIGKYLIKRIRIVAVEDVPASACGMYDVTVRFQSIEPRQRPSS